MEGLLLSKGLTACEVRVALLLGKGLTNKEIANLIFRAETTVKLHLTGVYKKLNLKNRAQFIQYFYALQIPVPKNETGDPVLPYSVKV